MKSKNSWLCLHCKVGNPTVSKTQLESAIHAFEVHGALMPAAITPAYIRALQDTREWAERHGHAEVAAYLAGRVEHVSTLLAQARDTEAA